MKYVGEKIIVKRLRKEKTKSGIIIPELDEDSPIMKGEVIGIGNRIPEESGLEDLKVGDVVVWMAYAGTEFEVDGQKLLVIRPNDVVAIEEPESNLVIQ